MRLIDADATKRRVADTFFDTLIPCVNCALDDSPTIDAVPVIRCRECKHHYWEQEPCHGKSVHYCKLPHMSGVEVFKEFFCYYGEKRRDKDGTN